MGEIKLIDVSKRFTLTVDGKEQTVQALDRLSFTVREREVVALIGPSGCGKTTALRIAMGLETASGGRVSVDGRQVTRCGHDRGMVFQHAELLPWLTARLAVSQLNRRGCVKRSFVNRKCFVIAGVRRACSKLASPLSLRERVARTERERSASRERGKACVERDRECGEKNVTPSSPA